MSESVSGSASVSTFKIDIFFDSDSDSDPDSENDSTRIASTPNHDRYRKMTDIDIRFKKRLKPADVMGLNFIREPAPYVFRPHPRQGLRSHIMEVLRPQDVHAEKHGVERDGVTWYPRAKPLKMLRLFRTQFDSRNDALEEIRRLKVIETYLPATNIARSEEFLVDYAVAGKRDILLCGLQVFVEGEILDPWSLDAEKHVSELLDCVSTAGESRDSRTEGARWCRVQSEVEIFIRSIKNMIGEREMIPDLAGIGNILLTRSGRIRLVDINNICRIRFDQTIHLDDKGYPACDKSIEALYLLERSLLEPAVDIKAWPYSHFLQPDRMKEVRRMEERFYERLDSERS